jgi:hypothetical protein
MRRALLLWVAFAACEEAPRPASPAVGPGTTAAARPAGPAPAASAPGASAAGKPAAGAAEAAAAAPRELSENDFVESLQNRDPFRSYLDEVAGPRNVQSEWEVLLRKYPLDELRLIAIVSGGTAPRAMFQDPTGTGVTVKRGDRLSKSEAKVTKILSDKVIVEIEDNKPGRAEPEVLRREVLLHPEEPAP